MVTQNVTKLKCEIDVTDEVSKKLNSYLELSEMTLNEFVQKAFNASFAGALQDPALSFKRVTEIMDQQETI